MLRILRDLISLVCLYYAMEWVMPLVHRHASSRRSRRVLAWFKLQSLRVDRSMARWPR